MTVPNRWTLMIVEDSDEDFDTLQEAVRKSGMSVEVRRVQSGGECVALLQGDAGFRPAVVIMDLNTPGVDGREALTTIKNDPTLRDNRVVVFSTSSDPKDLDFCYKAGANAYHVKPVRYPDHLETVTTMLHYWLGTATLPVAEGFEL